MPRTYNVVPYDFAIYVPGVIICLRETGGELAMSAMASGGIGGVEIETWVVGRHKEVDNCHTVNVE